MIAAIEPHVYSEEEKLHRELDRQPQLFRYMILASLIFGSDAVEAQPTFQQPASSLFADVRAHAIGDLVTILIIEESTASSSAKTSTDKGGELTLDGAGEGALSRLPFFGLSGTNRSKYSGVASTSRQGALRAKMTASIIEVKDNGVFIIEGSREVKINSETETTLVRGEVRPRDVSSGNTVYSYDIANVQITHLGKGTINTGQRPGLFTRLINWVF